METRQPEAYTSVLSEAVLDWGSLGPGEEWVTTATHKGELESGHFTAGFLASGPLKETDEDSGSEVNLNSSIMTEEEREEILQELAKLEEEIGTLRQVLSSKEKQHADLRQKLGINPLNEIRSNFNRGWRDVQTSVAYKKTSETLSTAGQKTSAAFSTLSSTISRKFEDMSLAGLEFLFPLRSNSIGYSLKQSVSMPAMRNSPSFRSLEEKMENTVSNIKTKVGASESKGNFEEVLSSAASASSQDLPTNNTMDSSERQC
ncbi:tumor protein D53 isoform X2 [Takifugu rubripes]|uniref:tumor protein D53 isoform X2 n=1 Tax=Takifugu rubripes TaxID=31033 RepID=UPI001145A2F9|nr:tumor protein D53 isoform X2 [Takifugu rubripes]